MFESLRSWATPYGGDAFLYITLLAVLSFAALLVLKPRLSTFTLNRMIRLGALIALPLSFVSMEMGNNNWGVAVVAIVWAVLVAIICKNETVKRELAKK
ncbi:hypothetical protein [Comamonas sp. NoAH]|uniref:hypothetical protein n=1 Tax=Comamonas halotolerans TaxID=3041496 RepID=UPI0024E0C31B|nr:hypothetical protein [Comamonas sp. NoAH]